MSLQARAGCCAESGPGRYAYGFLIHEAGEETAGQGYETGIRPDYNTDEYHLWQTSWDTVMKTVYKGDIYIMKGAVSGADTGL